MNQVDVVIIGAGVIGTSLAHELAGRGRSVVVLERDSPGRRATWAAAGLLSPLDEGAGDPDLLALADEGLARYPAFLGRLREETGIDVEYRTNGKLRVASSPLEVAELEALARGPFAERFSLQPLSAEQVRQLEPELAGTVRMGLLLGRDHRLNNRLLAQALASAAACAGAQVRTGTPVAAVVSRDGCAAGVRLQSGEELNAGRVVLAAGAWSCDLDGLPGAVPVFPVKGQMLAVDGRARHNGRGGRPPLERVVQGSAVNLIPREDGRILVGATMEEVGYRSEPTPRGLATLIDAGSRLMPLLADLPLVETWAGFRPATPDRRPILGADPELPGLFYATGHFRTGILLAPVTAQLLADCITGAGTSPLLAPFGIERFRPA